MRKKLKLLFLSVVLAVCNGEILNGIDPLQCCDIKDFVSRTEAGECNFHTLWDTEKRLTLKSEELEVSSTIDPPKNATDKKESPHTIKRHDIKILPLSCEKEICAFKKLNVLYENGTINKEAFLGFLENFVKEYPKWKNAKSIAVSRCLSNSVFLKHYDASCEINRLLMCLTDTLTQYCPNVSQEKAYKDDCKSPPGWKKSPLVCLISSSRYGPINRRRYCNIPPLVPYKVLDECEMASVIRLEKVPPSEVNSQGPKKNWFKWIPMCHKTANTTNCLMKKLDTINRYNFLDYMKMKKKLETYLKLKTEWQDHEDDIIKSFTRTPLYREHCTSQKTFFNVLDSLVTFCPVSRRSNSTECNKFFMLLEKPKQAEKPQPIQSTNLLRLNNQGSPKFIALRNFPATTSRLHVQYPNILQTTPTNLNNQQNINLGQPFPHWYNPTIHFVPKANTSKVMRLNYVPFILNSSTPFMYDKTKTFPPISNHAWYAKRPLYMTTPRLPQIPKPPYIITPLRITHIGANPSNLVVTTDKIGLKDAHTYQAVVPAEEKNILSSYADRYQNYEAAHNIKGVLRGGSKVWPRNPTAHHLPPAEEIFENRPALN